ncbi:hypothetical protein [Proteus columbae]|uniref:hypothetical protein n=1 Tax=Proteus columbae TaxID=1987580 RepID=UPI00288B0666|nr:hypothetical protein [Proteus columbae]
MKKIFLLFFLLCFLPISIYFYYMWFEFGYTTISNKNGEWGAFGSYLGGVLTPLFTLVSIFFIYYSIKNNNENHKIEMLYLNEQQTLLNISSLAASINDKLNGKIDFSNKLLKNKIVMVYSEDYLDDYLSWEVKNKIKLKPKVINLYEMNTSLIKILETYSFYRRNDIDFNFKYMNILRVVSYDYFNVFKITLEYINKIENENLKDNALMLLSAKVSKNAIINLYHLLADHAKYNIDAITTSAELCSLEDFVAASLEASNNTNLYKFSCIPLLVMLLEYSFIGLIKQDKYLEVFSIKNKVNIEINGKKSDECEISDFVGNRKSSESIDIIKQIFMYAGLIKFGGVFPYEIKGRYINDGNYFNVNVNCIIKLAFEEQCKFNRLEYDFYFRLNGTDFNLEQVWITYD